MLLAAQPRGLDDAGADHGTDGRVRERGEKRGDEARPQRVLPGFGPALVDDLAGDEQRGPPENLQRECEAEQQYDDTDRANRPESAEQAKEDRQIRSYGEKLWSIHDAPMCKARARRR